MYLCICLLDEASVMMIMLGTDLWVLQNTIRRQHIDFFFLPAVLGSPLPISEHSEEALLGEGEEAPFSNLGAKQLFLNRNKQRQAKGS